MTTIPNEIFEGLPDILSEWIINKMNDPNTILTPKHISQVLVEVCERLNEKNGTAYSFCYSKYC